VFCCAGFGRVRGISVPSAVAGVKTSCPGSSQLDQNVAGVSGVLLSVVMGSTRWTSSYTAATNAALRRAETSAAPRASKLAWNPAAEASRTLSSGQVVGLLVTGCDDAAPVRW
jgi:hypothetical protein